MLRNRIKGSKTIAFIIIFVMILSACQTFTIPAETSNNPSTQTPPAIRASETVAPTATNVPTPTNTAEPTLSPPSFWHGELPEFILEHIQLPTGAQWVDEPGMSRCSIDFVTKENEDNALFQSSWTYVLVAPFFTVIDSLSRNELIYFLDGSSLPQGITEDTQVLVSEADRDLILAWLNLSSAPRLKSVSSLDAIQADAWGQDWAILPIEVLEPQWKVINIDGHSPFSNPYNPKQYALSVFFGIFENKDLTHQASLEDFELSKILPPGNYAINRLTSLIMTGVTAMARETAYVMETEGVRYPGTAIRDLMRSANLTHISNEVSFYEDCPYPDPNYEGFIFCSNPEYIKLLDDLGANIIELTGNHNNDVRALYGVDSVPFTLDLYEEYEMQWYGGGLNAEDAKKPLLIEHNGNRLAFIGCNSYGPEMAWATESESGAAPCEDFVWLKDELSRLRAEGYIPIVTFQFQEDYIYEPTTLQLQDFRDVASVGPAIINGSQSHVAKAIDFYDGTFIHYGLGNLFFFQNEFFITYNSFIQKHYFYEGRHINTRLYTITVDDSAKPRFMTIEERQAFLAKVFSLSEDFRRTQ